MCVTRLSVTEFCVKDVTCGEWCVWQSSVWQMICDTVVPGKLVSARWCGKGCGWHSLCLPMLCVCLKHAVWHRWCVTEFHVMGRDGALCERWPVKLACDKAVWKRCGNSVCDRWCVFDRCCVAKTVCDRVFMWQNYVWWMVCVSSCKWQSRVWKMVGDKVVCEWWRLTTWCVPDCVWQSFCQAKMWQSCVWQVVCEKNVCERRCVTELCVKGGVWSGCVWSRCVWKVVCDKGCGDKGFVCAEVGSETYCVAQ